MALALDDICRDLLASQIEWLEYCMEMDINAWGAKCTGGKVHEPTPMRGPTQSARAALLVRGTPSARTRAKYVGRGSIAQAAIAWRGEWAALPTHLPLTCHAMATQCNRGSTRVGRDGPQSPSTLRVKIHVQLQTFIKEQFAQTFSEFWYSLCFFTWRFVIWQGPSKTCYGVIEMFVYIQKIVCDIHLYNLIFCQIPNRTNCYIMKDSIVSKKSWLNEMVLCLC